MRVLVSSTPGTGHVLPLLPLAVALRRRGHDVLWATAADACGRLRAAGIDATEAGLTDAEVQPVRAELHRLAKDLPREQLPTVVFPRMFGAARTGPMLARLLPAARDWRPDLVVHEPGELAGPLVASLLGIPNVTHAFGGGIPAAIVADGGAAIADLWAEHGLQVPPYAGCYQHLYVDICPSLLQTVPLEHIAQVQAARPVAYDGEGVPDVRADLPDGGDTPLVYVTLGTVHNNGELLHTVTSAVASLGVRVVVTVGPGVDPAELAAQPPTVTVRSWLPQAAVLPHCSAVVSHGGSGTVLGTAAVGLPQVCLPQAADQFRNAAGVVRARAGVALHPDVASPGAVAEAVRAVLDDEVLREGAGRVRDEIAAMPAPDEVVDRLERLSPGPAQPRRRG